MAAESEELLRSILSGVPAGKVWNEIGVVQSTTPSVTVSLESDGLDPNGNMGTPMPAMMLSDASAMVGDRVILARVGDSRVIMGVLASAPDTLHPLTIGGGFIAWGGLVPPTYSKVNGLVVINGYIQRSPAASVAGATYTLQAGALPVGYRPSAATFSNESAWPASTSTINCRSSVNAAGDLLYLTSAAIANGAGCTLHLSYIAEA